VSIISLWKAYLAPLKLEVAAGELRFRIYPVKNSVKKWYLPTFTVPISLANVGAKPGKVLSLRLVAHYPQIKPAGAKETFRWYGEVEPRQFRKDAQHIFKWQNTSVIAGNEPFIVPPKSTYTKYMVFKKRWDHPVGAKEIRYTLQIYTDRKNKWHDIETWTMSLTPLYWSELTENLSSIGVSSDSTPRKYTETIPKDLHSLIRIDSKIPKGGFQTEPTYVDSEATDEDKV